MFLEFVENMLMESQRLAICPCDFIYQLQQFIFLYSKQTDM